MTDDTILGWYEHGTMTREYRFVDGRIHVRNPSEGIFGVWRPSVEYFGADGWNQLLADSHVKSVIPPYMQLSEGF